MSRANLPLDDPASFFTSSNRSSPTNMFPPSEFPVPASPEPLSPSVVCKCVLVFEKLVDGTELENCFELSVHFLRSFLSDSYQERSSKWRAQKRIYRRSRAVIGREAMGVTAKLL